MKVRFNNKLYSMTALNEAISAFSDVADFVKTREAGHTVVDVKPSDPHDDTDEVTGEFMNYVLGGTIAKRGTK